MTCYPTPRRARNTISSRPWSAAAVGLDGWGAPAFPAGFDLRTWAKERRKNSTSPTSSEDDRLEERLKAAVLGISSVAFSTAAVVLATQLGRRGGADVETEITLEFREAAKGTTIPLQLTGEAPCTTCHGSGSKSGKASQCKNCKGTGFSSENRGAFAFSAPCTECGGTGQKIEDPCTDCNGSGTVHRTRSITVRIPAGVIDGQKVRLAGQGEAGPNGTPAGDLFVAVKVKPDKVFTREGDDLHVTVPVSFAELALGDTITVPTLDSPVRVKVPAGTSDRRTLRVRNRGVAKRGGKSGDLLVTVQVTVPTNLDGSATSALRTYAQAERDSGFDPRAGWEGNVSHGSAAGSA